MVYSEYSAYISGMILLMLQISVLASDHNSLSQFSSHVRVNTPARSYSHGVGDPISTIRSRSYRQPPRGFRRLRIPTSLPRVTSHHSGYPKVRPSIPFQSEEIPQDNTINLPWHNHYDQTLPILPPSPYKVDSPDPESLWPEGLFLPPIRPYHFGNTLQSIGRRNGGNGQVLSENEPVDPYLLEGSEAIEAVARAKDNGFLYFHLIPHIESLMANQKLRIKNKLKPHRIGSIRHTWPYYRP